MPFPRQAPDGSIQRRPACRIRISIHPCDARASIIRSARRGTPLITKLDRRLKREITIKGNAYVLTLDDTGLQLTLKGRRKGQQLRWDDFVTGDAAFATALNASLARANDTAIAAKATGKKRRAKS